MYKVAGLRDSTKIERIFSDVDEAFKFYYSLTHEGFKAEVWELEKASFGLHVAKKRIHLNS